MVLMCINQTSVRWICEPILAVECESKQWLFQVWIYHCETEINFYRIKIIHKSIPRNWIASRGTGQHSFSSKSAVPPQCTSSWRICWEISKLKSTHDTNLYMVFWEFSLIPPNSFWYRQIQFDTVKFSLIPSNSVWYCQIQFDTVKFSLIPSNSVWYRQIQFDTAKLEKLPGYPWSANILSLYGHNFQHPGTHHDTY